MEERTFIQVILPLRLEWEPYYALPAGLSVQAGDRVRVVFAHKEYTGVVSAVNVVPDTDGRRVQEIVSVEALPRILPEEIRLWRAVGSYYLCSIGEVFKAAYPALKVDQEEVGARTRERLEARLALWKDRLAKARKEETRLRYQAAVEALEAQLRGENAPVETGSVHLSPAQETACEAIRAAFRNGKTALLHGITGSGKTEIYLQLAAETLRSGRSVLYLVPEIALSRQLEERIAALFPAVHVYHSGETAARRQEVADAVRTSDTCLVLGTRSSLFLPHHNLGLIIVDEEHDTSYKQDSPAPRYQGRDTAIMLGVIQGASVILGSATPSLESIYNADTGRFAKVELNERFHPAEEAGILIIDTVAERRKRGMVGNLSRKLLAEMQRTLSEGGQILLLRARRSYAPAVQCTECGKIVKCPRCNVSLCLHRNPDRLVCHYCGHTRPYTGTCPDCGSPLQPLGAGAQKIEEEVRTLFPEARIGRIDSDTPQEQLRETIHAFSQGGLDILVGTQIITKGFDFDRLQLVAVLQADQIVGQQDFRADERAFQLLEQFRGRSGRREKPGLLVIQTREPEHPVFQQLDGRREERLLPERRLFGYPPYTRIVQLVLKDTSEGRINLMGSELQKALTASLPPTAAIIGPYAPLVDRVAGRFLRHIRVMLPRDKALTTSKQALARTVSAFEKERRYPGHIVIDVDPV